MWIIISIILAVIILFLVGNNGMLRNENNGLRYTNVYLFTRFVKDNGEEGIRELQEEMEKVANKFNKN
ncbi:DUF1514 family protein [Staphylococcus pasteuri]|uniref:DUF1514 domain-containing protein n=2 Tax=Staphylococcus TaxID=1279 RepID=A0ABY1H0C8_9STAP|nr:MULTISPECIES: DUF1514 family protein [Staphylococcus]ODB81797.1 DUF1514 domain-containing protein [Staphylococcus sp. AOAB]RQX27079.1 DUF1514 domain-containing protein [Staphylococcus warneri]ATH63192.1 DUF1514 domain-containing protein [Staphylococcus pasteuri]MBM6506684.1 DUF1514 family protein [Staphylococcus pasteuri]MCF7600859.1 DUF1514 family protein [Staphylococcus pasteuri]